MLFQTHSETESTWAPLASLREEARGGYSASRSLWVALTFTTLMDRRAPRASESLQTTWRIHVSQGAPSVSQSVSHSVIQSCPTLWDPMDYTAVHGILQPRILEWVVFPFSRGYDILMLEYI